VLRQRLLRCLVLFSFQEMRSYANFQPLEPGPDSATGSATWGQAKGAERAGRRHPGGTPGRPEARGLHLRRRGVRPPAHPRRRAGGRRLRRVRTAGPPALAGAARPGLLGVGPDTGQGARVGCLSPGRFLRPARGRT